MRVSVAKLIDGTLPYSSVSVWAGDLHAVSRPDSLDTLQAPRRYQILTGCRGCEPWIAFGTATKWGMRRKSGFLAIIRGL